MKNKYTSTTKLLVVISSALIGYSLACFFHQFFKIGILSISIALIMFGIAVYMVYKRNNPGIEIVNKDNDDVKKSIDENDIDEKQFEDDICEEDIKEPEIENLKKDEDKTDDEVLNEFRG